MSEFPPAIVATMDESTKKLKVQAVRRQRADGALECSPKRLHSRTQSREQTQANREILRPLRVEALAGGATGREVSC